ncbi:hydrolase [Actinomycetospora sp. NBRC 106375]|uniref:alpha/beta fold hydrolase n=1 Tax=Actinomycetospora sp. NBRC 106375 TaxID=3032207 RepID=UPI0024A0F718|nr:alpha/beta hydrolase [Actinomycetospora sp. NBRC 106375]GLZ44182.1 hydrolase [Actinomycetospora sp. NBRC 106375]
MSFERVTTTVHGTELVARVGGSGPGLLLLHGFPQTHEAWRHVAPELARSLGHETVAVAGHDRGALVAVLAALDRPDAVTRLAVLDVLPALDLWHSLHGTAGVFAFHLFLLAHPAPLPETMLAAAPDAFFGHFLDTWTLVPDAIPAEVRARYLAAGRRSIDAVRADYRASAGVDLEHDRADRRAGRTVAAPTLALWQDPGDAELPFDPGAVWACWAPDLTTGVVAGGHFLPEEAPEIVTEALRRHLAR